MADQGELRAAAERVSRRYVTAYPDTPEGEAAWVARELLRRLPPADDAEPVTVEWLLTVGWTKYVHWPSIPIAGGDLLEWRGAGMWIGETPICLTSTRGHVRRLCAALGVELREAP